MDKYGINLDWVADFLNKEGINFTEEKSYDSIENDEQKKLRCIINERWDKILSINKKKERF